MKIEEIFKKERMIEKEAEVLIQYLTLLKLASLLDDHKNKEEIFALAHGNERFEKVLSQAKEININLLDGTPVLEYYEKLKQDVEYLSGITVSKSAYTKKIMEDFSELEKYYSKEIDKKEKSQVLQK